MTIRGKANRKQIDEIISKGGAVPSSNAPEWTSISMRITKGLIKEIDENVKPRLAMTRTAWILEAIQEKLNRSKEKREE
jgi:predicted house-cleaning noncanonical NTP pyrophosphatase (MazG superfamily)